MDFEAAPVGAGVHGLDALHARDAAPDGRHVHQEVPQALARHRDDALLCERHRAARRARRAASHACASARPIITAVISRLYAADPRWSSRGSTSPLAASPTAFTRPSSSRAPGSSASAARPRSGVVANRVAATTEPTAHSRRPGTDNGVAPRLFSRDHHGPSSHLPSPTSPASTPPGPVSSAPPTP